MPSPTHRAMLGGLVVVLLGVGAAQARQGTAPEGVQEELEAQRALNRELLLRLEALEASHRALLESLPQGTAGAEAELDREVTRFVTELEAGRIEPAGEPWQGAPVLSGYYDFEYFNDDRRDSPGTFRHHRLSVHLSKELGRFRIFSEVEFEYGTRFSGSGGTQLEEAVGELKLEQAWGEYLHSDLLTLRGGHILTPGHWNVSHYPNVVLSTRTPLMVRRVYPEAFTGILGYGSWFWKEAGVTYRAFAGNGMSRLSPKKDDNEGKAVGGRITLHLPRWECFFTFDVGASAYLDEPTGSERVGIWGVDAQIAAGGFELLAEYARRDSVQDRAGLYVQPSYRWSQRWAAFYRLDLLRTDRADDAREHTIGLNFRPIPPVSLKLELYRSLHSETEDFNGVATSVAIAF